MKEMMKTKASKVDFGELYKKYSNLYLNLEPIIGNIEALKTLSKRLSDNEQP
jgi:hypothetical protein